MATTYTNNLALSIPGTNDAGWAATLNGNRVVLDALAALGSLAVKTAEQPSSSLNISVSSGVYRKSDGTIATYAGTSSFALTTAATNYVYLTDSGTLTKSTTAFPTTGNNVRLATVVAGATTITSIVDSRIPFVSMGGHAHWGVGTPTVAAGTGAGTSPTLSVSGSDQGGVLTVTTGTSPTASATVATVTFGMAFSATPRSVILTPAGSNTAALSGNAQVYVDTASTSTTVFVVKVGSTNLTASTTYKWHYAVIG